MKRELVNLIDDAKKALLENVKKVEFIERTTSLRPRENEDDLNKCVFLTLLQVAQVSKGVQRAFMVLFNCRIDEIELPDKKQDKFSSLSEHLRPLRRK